MDVEEILTTVGREVEKGIETLLPRKGVKNLNDAVWYHLDTGGKRLRPALAILTYKALKGDAEKIIPFACACEILHNWFLIHDDIEDGDVIRRNKETVWKKYGLAHGINVGDYMSEKVYEFILSLKDRGFEDKTVMRLLKEVVFTSIKTAEGQTRDMNLRNNNNPTEEEYMKTVKEKTAYYMTMPIVGAAILAGIDDEMIERIKNIGMKIGPAFQITDDILDLTEGKGRGDIGSDIREGKRSILVVHCSRLCNDEEREKLFSILNKPREETTQEDVLYVKSLFEKYGSVDYAKDTAKKLIEEAKEEIKKLPPELSEIMEAFANYMIERKK